MNWIDSLMRPEIRALRGYQAADYAADTVRLNANEAPWRAPGDDGPRGLNTYPPPRPAELSRVLAAHYGVAADQLLVTRGSSEAIDLLIRTFCAPGTDRILICPPTFGMYQVYAAVQGVEIRRIPLLLEADFALDLPAVLDAVRKPVKLVFLCSPNNPTGNALQRAAVERICARVANNQGLVVIDEAYVDFLEEPSFRDLMLDNRHVVLLRTLSKAHALAGARVGALVAHAEVIEAVARVMPPYGIPSPSITAALRSLEGDTVAQMQERIRGLLAERARLTAAFGERADVSRVYPSQANFLLVRVANREAWLMAARRRGILIRAFDGEPALTDCVRISVGSVEHNDALLGALSEV